MPKAVPYGIYDLSANTGWVTVGSDGDTAAFAVATLRRWWTQVGQGAYPTAKRLLINADAEADPDDPGTYPVRRGAPTDAAVGLLSRALRCHVHIVTHKLCRSQYLS